MSRVIKPRLGPLGAGGALNGKIVPGFFSIKSGLIWEDTPVSWDGSFFLATSNHRYTSETPEILVAKYDQSIECFTIENEAFTFLGQYSARWCPSWPSWCNKLQFLIWTYSRYIELVHGIINQRSSGNTVFQHLFGAFIWEIRSHGVHGAAVSFHAKVVPINPMNLG